jgi:hypothetical protein
MKSSGFSGEWRDFRALSAIRVVWSSATSVRISVPGSFGWSS